MSSSPEAASSPASTSEIDYEALAKAAYNGPDCQPLTWEGIARAVVAAYEQQLRDQGFVVARKDYLGKLLSAYVNDTREYLQEHYGNTEDLDDWLNNPTINHIKSVLDG